MKSKFEIIKAIDEIGFNQITIKNCFTNELISILPEYGARLNKAYLLVDDVLFSVIKELKVSELKTNDELFNNALLFPFAGRIKNGSYSFNDEIFYMPINYKTENNACHGFLYQEKFDVISEYIESDYAEVVLSFQQKKYYPGYPFTFNVFVSYKLNVSGEVTVSTQIENTNNTQILFSNGWHPYYTFENCVDDLIVEFSPNERIELDSNNIPNGNKNNFSLNHHQKIDLENKNLDDVFKLLPMNDRNEVILTSKKKTDKLKLWQQASIDKYNYLVLYIPPDRKSIAIEPITSNIDSFNNKEDVVILQAGAKWNSSFGFCIIKNKYIKK